MYVCMLDVVTSLLNVLASKTWKSIKLHSRTRCAPKNTKGQSVPPTPLAVMQQRNGENVENQTELRRNA